MTRPSELNDYSKKCVAKHVERCLIRHFNVQEDEVTWAPRTVEEAQNMSDKLISGAITVFLLATGLHGKALSDIDFYKLIPTYVKDLDFRAKINELLSHYPAPNQKVAPR